MLKRIILFIGVFYTLTEAQVSNPVYGKYNFYENLRKKNYTNSDLKVDSEKPISLIEPNKSDFSFSLASNAYCPVNNFTPGSSDLNSSFYSKLSNELQSYMVYPEFRSKFEKLAYSQLIFAGMGIVDYTVKEAPKYPGFREDNFFWQTAWGTMVWGSSISHNLLFVKDSKYLLGLLTEDMTYYLCRNIFHKQSFPNSFGLPLKVMGANNLPMSTVVVLWAAASLYLILDAAEIL